MSYHTMFDFAVGLAKPIRCPKGTLEGILAHVREVETALKLETEQFLDNPPHWKSNEFADISDEILCEVAQCHNDWVWRLYRKLAEWSAKPLRGKDTEKITPEDAKKFWHGLQHIIVPPERWTAEYYRDRMECLYSVMRGNPTDGITFDGDPLTTDQARNVIILFSEFLDTHDIRLDVPKGHDDLASSYDGEYDWCERCGAIDGDEVIENKDGRPKCPFCKKWMD